MCVRACVWARQVRFIVEEKERLPAFIVKERVAERDRQQQQQRQRQGGQGKKARRGAAKATKGQTATAKERSQGAATSGGQAAVVTATVNSDVVGDKGEGKEKPVGPSGEEQAGGHAAADESRGSAAVKSEGADLGRMTEWGNYIVDGQRKRGQKRKNLADDIEDGDYEEEEGQEEDEEFRAKRRKREKEREREVEIEVEEETADDDPQDILEEAKIEVGRKNLQTLSAVRYFVVPNHQACSSSSHFASSRKRALSGSVCTW